MRKSTEERERLIRLARVDRFRDLTDQEVGLVVDAARYLTIPEGWALIMESTPADKAYLILAGEVSIRRHGEEVARSGAGEVIGEMALVDHKLRNATVIATTELEVLHFTDETVAELQEKMPHFRDALTGAAEERKQH